MNYIPYQLPALCTSCGARIADEPEDPTGYACDDCFCESERKAHEENLRDFRWCARNWLRCDTCKGTGERISGRAGYCYCHIGNALHEAEAARFAFVRSLPALAVTSARALREEEIDPQERIAK